jgi:phosphohistidine phosphatase SixA
MDRYLKEKQISPDTIWHSPLLRAKETAEIIASDFATNAQEEADLGLSFDEQKLLKKLPLPHENRCLFLVGHGPSLHRFIAYILGKQVLNTLAQNSSATVIDFPDRIAPGSAIFKAYYSPDEIVFDKQFYS